jgi:hypothetical protein
MAKYQAEFLTDPAVRGKMGTNAQGIMYRESMLENAKRFSKELGGVNTYLGAGAVFNSVEPDGDIRDAVGAARAAGFNKRIVNNMMNSWSMVRQGIGRSPMSNQIISDAYSAATRFESQAKDFADGKGGVTRDDMLANGAVLMTMARRYRSFMTGQRGLSSTPKEVELRGELMPLADYIAKNPDGDHIAALHMLKQHPNMRWDEIEGKPKEALDHVPDQVNAKLGSGKFENLTGNDASRLLQWIGNESAKNLVNTSRELLLDPGNYDRMRKMRGAIHDMKLIEGDTSAAAGGTGGVAANPRGTDPHPSANWTRRMGELQGGFGSLDNYKP